MRPTMLSTLPIFIVAVFGLMANQQRLAAQLLPPSVEANADYESELPSPPQSSGREHSVLLEPPLEPEAAIDPIATYEPERIRDFSQAYLGVTFDPQYQTAAVARSVTAGSPADQAGIKAGDTIVSVNGRRITGYDDVLRWVDRLKPGDVLDIDVTRRVSVKARAVLDGQPVGARTTNYRPVIERLPEPTQVRPAPRANLRPQMNRPTNSNRNDGDTQRDNRGRRGFRRR
jgi:membrane-associated protease RseP (regulator of RpoE activity)